MIVRITVVAMLVVEVDALGGGGGSTAPGECNIPANTETVSVRLSATIALVRRNLLIVVVLRCLENFASFSDRRCKKFYST
jgi:hypothetical protein